jgi:hypothetical protein
MILGEGFKLIELTQEEREEYKSKAGITDEQLDDELNKINNANVDDDKSIPSAPSREDILKFLKYVLEMKTDEVDSFLRMNRTGNLSEHELGNLVFSTRKYNDVANYADLVGYTGFAKYSRSKASNIITTSTSKKGFFLQLITTNKRITKNVGDKKVTKKSSLFGGTEEVVQGGDEE